MVWDVIKYWNTNILREEKTTSQTIAAIVIRFKKIRRKKRRNLKTYGSKHVHFKDHSVSLYLKQTGIKNNKIYIFLEWCTESVFFIVLARTQLIGSPDFFNQEWDPIHVGLCQNISQVWEVDPSLQQVPPGIGLRPGYR